MLRNSPLLLSMVFVLLLSGCVVQPVTPEAPDASTPSTEATAEPTTETASEEGDLSSFSEEALSNLSYQLGLPDLTPVQLVDGVYEDQPNRVLVQWTDTYALGELQGQAAAAVILYSNMGGSGGFSTLAVVLEQEGELVNVASALVGDRVRINWLTLEDGEIVLDFVTQGPDEAMCCGTQRTLATFALQDGELVATTTEVLGTQEGVSETQVISFTPIVIPEESQEGNCFANAIGLGRADAWRCMVGNQIYDPCFQVDDAPTLVCGVDPLQEDGGFVLELTEPLPDVNAGEIALPWIIELDDGTVCRVMTGTIPGVGDETAPYGCADDAQSYLMATLDTELPVWFARRVTFDLGEDGFSIRSSVRQPVASVWQ